MKPSPFAYTRATSVADAVAAFRESAEARYLAGGQSLIPALNLRLQAPELLIDIAHIAALRGIVRHGDELRIGALTRHAEMLASPLVAEAAPLLAAAAPWVAHPAIRNKGTLGGSLSLADPASEFPAVALALDARIELDDGERVRSVEAQDFFRDLYETAAEPGEILTAVYFPVARPGQRFVFDEFARRRGDFALVGVAIAGNFVGEVAEQLRIVFFAVGPTPTRARLAEATLTGTRLAEADIARAVHALAEDLPDIPGDAQTSAATRLHLARVLLKRQLARLRDGSQALPA